MDKYRFVLFEKLFISKLKESLKNPYCGTKVPSDHPLYFRNSSTFCENKLITRVVPVSCLCSKIVFGATGLA